MEIDNWPKAILHEWSDFRTIDGNFSDSLSSIDARPSSSSLDSMQLFQSMDAINYVQAHSCRSFHKILASSTRMFNETIENERFFFKWHVFSHIFFFTWENVLLAIAFFVSCTHSLYKYRLQNVYQQVIECWMKIEMLMRLA